MDTQGAGTWVFFLKQPPWPTLQRVPPSVACWVCVFLHGLLLSAGFVTCCTPTFSFFQLVQKMNLDGNTTTLQTKEQQGPSSRLANQLTTVAHKAWP